MWFIYSYLLVTLLFLTNKVEESSLKIFFSIFKYILMIIALKIANKNFKKSLLIL
jgi:hypothetical protein